MVGGGWGDEDVDKFRLSKSDSTADEDESELFSSELSLFRFRLFTTRAEALEVEEVEIAAELGLALVELDTAFVRDDFSTESLELFVFEMGETEWVSFLLADLADRGEPGELDADECANDDVVEEDEDTDEEEECGEDDIQTGSVIVFIWSADGELEDDDDDDDVGRGGVPGLRGVGDKLDSFVIFYLNFFLFYFYFLLI